LGRNSINQLTVDQNRRDELMGRKKKKSINDSVLGGLINYGKAAKYKHVHLAIDFMLKTG